ncbi:MAG: glycerol-3-phosphate acyltransferase, partial [Gammaproteobacteria bacterium]
GVLLGLHWITGLAAIATWLALALLFRLSSLAALGAAFMTPLYLHWLDAPLPFVSVAVIMSTFLLWRHRVNIHNLLHGM